MARYLLKFLQKDRKLELDLGQNISHLMQRGLAAGALIQSGRNSKRMIERAKASSAEGMPLPAVAGADREGW